MSANKQFINQTGRGGSVKLISLGALDVCPAWARLPLPPWAPRALWLLAVLVAQGFEGGVLMSKLLGGGGLVWLLWGPSSNLRNLLCKSSNRSCMETKLYMLSISMGMSALIGAERLPFHALLILIRLLNISIAFSWAASSAVSWSLCSNNCCATSSDFRLVMKRSHNFNSTSSLL